MSAALLGAGAVVGAGIPGAHAAPAPLTVPGGIEFATTVAGFAPGAVVEQRLDRGRGTAGRADASGVLHVRLVAPAEVGSHRLLLIGAGPVTGTAPPGTVYVTVPRLVTVPLVVVPAATVLPESSDGSGHGPSAGDRDQVASTGLDVLTGVAIGTMLALAGAVAMWCGRHRRPNGPPRRASRGVSA